MTGEEKLRMCLKAKDGSPSKMHVVESCVRSFARCSVSATFKVSESLEASEKADLRTHGGLGRDKKVHG